MTDAPPTATIPRVLSNNNNNGNGSSSSSLSSAEVAGSDRFNITDSFPIRNSNELTGWLESIFSPTVLVRTTPSVEASCMKNGLKFIDLLRPYQFSKQLNYSSISLQNFSVNFVTLGDLHKEYGENGNRIANRTEVHLREKHHSDFIGHIIKHSYDQYLRRTNQSALNQDLVDHTPWFDIFRDEFIKNLNISEHETFLHPVAVVSVISSEEAGDPIQVLKGLFDPDNPPRMFKDFTMDPDILNLVIMTHDQSSPTTSSEKANSIFNKIKEKYTASSCRMLILNSRDHLVENLVGDIWTPVLPRRQSYQKYVLDNIQPNGFYLSKQDVQYVANNVDFITNQVVASMDAKIKTVSNTVLASKKGIKNTIKSWFTKKTKAEEEGISPEMQLRRLADLLFLLREYDEAYSVYKLISGDFKKDHKNFAGCLEMMAICSLLSQTSQSSSKKEMESNMDNALTSYKNANQPNYTLRLLLFQACYYRSKMLFKKAGELFTRASNVDENNFLQAALFFEQTALCYRGSMDRLTRKSALFLILAGYRYSHTDQMKHSFRCYRTSFRIYNNKEWLQIYEHLSYTLGKLTNDMKDLKSSVEFYHEFLSVCKQGPDQQFKFMEVFSQTVSSYINEQKQKGVEDLKFDFLEMPKVDQSNVRVLLNSYYGEPVYTDVVPDEEWAKLEETLVRKVRGPIVFFKWEKGINDMKKIESTIVGEPIHVDVRISNTLIIPVQVKDICLDAILKSPNLEENEKGFIAEAVNVSIQGSDTIVVRLKITPTVVGDLSIRGVKWKILNNIQGFKHFNVKGRRLNDTKQHRTSVQYEQDNRLILKVVDPTPLLDVQFTETIEQLWNGELRKTSIIITNVGKADLKNLKLKINHPSIYFLSDDPNLNNFQFVDANTSEKDTIFISNTYGIERDFTYYDVCESLSTGSQLEIPVFVRGSYSGVHDAKFLFYYEPVEPVEDLKYRLHRFHTTLKVMDSLRVTTFCDSSYSELGTFICGVKLHNLRPDQFIQVDQLVSVSPLWEITPVIPVNGQSIIVMPKESYTLYLKIFKNIEQEKKMASIISTKEKLPDIELIHRSFSAGNNERLIDTTKRPYLEFLFSESKKHELTFFGKTVTTESGDSLVDIEEQLNSLSLQTVWRGGPCELGITYHSKVSFLPHAKKPKRIHMAAKFPTKENLICPLEVNLEYERDIFHQFTPSQPSCTVTFDVKIGNVSPDLHTDITLELLPPFASSGTSKLRAQSVLPTSVTSTTGPQNFYLWCGPTRFFMKDLKPNSESKVTVQATFFSPGVYNLNQFRISWKFMDQSNITRVIPHTFVEEQYLISVIQPEIIPSSVPSSNPSSNAVDDLFL